MHTVTTAARHVVAGDRIARIDRTTFGPGLLVEGTATGPEPVDPESGIEVTSMSVWFGTWMGGLEVDPDEEVDILTERTDVPPPVDRTGQVRVHGTWQPQGTTTWAPDGYPFRTHEEVRG